MYLFSVFFPFLMRILFYFLLPFFRSFFFSVLSFVIYFLMAAMWGLDEVIVSTKTCVSPTIHIQHTLQFFLYFFLSHASHQDSSSHAHTHIHTHTKTETYSHTHSHSLSLTCTNTRTVQKGNVRTYRWMIYCCINLFLYVYLCIINSYYS